MNTRITHFGFCWILFCVCWGALSTSVKQDPATESPVKSVSSRVYVKIILPVEQPPIKASRIVESWIGNLLRNDKALMSAKKEQAYRAVTGWVQLPEEGQDMEPVWDAVVDQQVWGCPVVGAIAERTNGTVKVNLTGWAPVDLKKSGLSLPDEIGNRSIAVIDEGIAYVAIIVVPNR